MHGHFSGKRVGGQQGSLQFRTYAQNLRHLYASDVIETQARVAREAQFRASIVQPSIPETDNLTAAFEYHRARPKFGE